MLWKKKDRSICRSEISEDISKSHGESEHKEYACNVRDLGSIPGSGRSPGEGNNYPLQYWCLEDFMDTGAWWAIVEHD